MINLYHPSEGPIIRCTSKSAKELERLNSVHLILLSSTSLCCNSHKISQSVIFCSSFNDRLVIFLKSLEMFTWGDGISMAFFPFGNKLSSTIVAIDVPEFGHLGWLMRERESTRGKLSAVKNVRKCYCFFHYMENYIALAPKRRGISLPLPGYLLWWVIDPSVREKSRWERVRGKERVRKREIEIYTERGKRKERKRARAGGG